MKLRTEAAGETSSRPLRLPETTSLAGLARFVPEAGSTGLPAPHLPDPRTSTQSVQRGNPCTCRLSHTI